MMGRKARGRMSAFVCSLSLSKNVREINIAVDRHKYTYFKNEEISTKREVRVTVVRT
jgi:hypothetical protein